MDEMTQTLKQGGTSMDFGLLKSINAGDDFQMQRLEDENEYLNT